MLDPGDGRVHVAIDFELTNLKPNSATTVFYYSSYLTAIHPDAVGLRVTDAAGALSVTTKERRFFTRLEVHLRNFLYYNQSTRFTVRYDLVGGAPRSEFVRPRGPGVRDVRGVGMGRPRPEHGRGQDCRPATRARSTATTCAIDGDGPGETLTAEPARPDTFYAILSAENRAAYTLHAHLAPGWRSRSSCSPGRRTIAGRRRRATRSGRALPELVELIGLDWPVNHDLEVLERFTPALEGYAGVFFTDDERIELSEDLDPLMTMHEASHAWFNDSLFAERWIYEGLAEEYAWRVQDERRRERGLRPARAGRGRSRAASHSRAGPSRRSSATRRPTIASATATRPRSG